MAAVVVCSCCAAVWHLLVLLVERGGSFLDIQLASNELPQT